MQWNEREILQFFNMQSSVILTALLLAFCAVAQSKPNLEEVAAAVNGYFPTQKQSFVFSAKAAAEPVKEGDQCNTGDIACVKGELFACNKTSKYFNYGKCSASESCDCDGKKCIPTSSSTCLEPVTDECTVKGKLPVASDCKKFEYCNGTVATIGNCNGDLRYHANLGKCVSPTTLPICSRPVCSTSRYPTNVAFQAFPNFYLVCIPNQPAMSYVAKCPENYEMVNNKCTFKCSQEGQVQSPDPTECNAGVYYVCSKYGTGYTTKAMNCPAGTKWDEVNEVCTDTAICKATETTQSTSTATETNPSK